MSNETLITSVDIDSAIVDFLRMAKLPVDDVHSAGLLLFACQQDGILRATVALEVFSPVALLRSLAVDPLKRNTGLGVAMVAHAECVAKQQSLAALYLLTTTADSFFKNLGYTVIAREAAPATIAASSQFADVCPASAVLMCKTLDG